MGGPTSPWSGWRGGTSAAELAARGPLSPREALEVLEQVGAALAGGARARASSTGTEARRT